MVGVISKKQQIEILADRLGGSPLAHACAAAHMNPDTAADALVASAQPERQISFHAPSKRGWLMRTTSTAALAMGARRG